MNYDIFVSRLIAMNYADSMFVAKVARVDICRGRWHFGRAALPCEDDQLI
jgi:hypothetical protein